MTPKQFIEKAIRGGYDSAAIINGEPSFTVSETEHPFLNPLAWSAVGKVEGWAEKFLDYERGEIQCPACGEEPDITEPWRYNMHRMIDALCEGRTIEQFLETL